MKEQDVLTTLDACLDCLSTEYHLSNKTIHKIVNDMLIVYNPNENIYKEYFFKIIYKIKMFPRTLLDKLRIEDKEKENGHSRNKL